MTSTKNTSNNSFSNYSDKPKDYRQIYPVYIDGHAATKLINIWRSDPKVDAALLKVHGRTYYVGRGRPSELSWTAYDRNVWLVNPNLLLVKVYDQMTSHVYMNERDIDRNHFYFLRIRITKARRAKMQALIDPFIKRQKLHLAQNRRDDEEDEKRKRKYFDEVSKIHEDLFGYPLDIADVTLVMDAYGEISCSYKTC